MSQENVERIRHAHDALNRSGQSLEEAQRIATELLHPEIEWHDQPELPGATVHRGIDAVMRHLAAAQESLDYGPGELVEILDVGSSVVGVFRVHASGRASGVEVERDAVYVYSFRGAKIERVAIFGTKAEALEAAGLRE
jgi:ketosteroid isomerase-like protein